MRLLHGVNGQIVDEQSQRVLTTLENLEKRQSTLQFQLTAIELKIQSLKTRSDEIQTIDAKSHCIEALEQAVMNRNFMQSYQKIVTTSHAILKASLAGRLQLIQMDQRIENLMTQITDRIEQQEIIKKEIEDLESLGSQVAPLQTLLEKLILDNETSQAALQEARQKRQELSGQIQIGCDQAPNRLRLEEHA